MKKKSTKNKKYVSKSDILFMAAIFLIVSVSYFLYSLQFQGPAYLSDEISYITKAAAIAGNTVDAGNSWHAGYSILLSPVYLFIKDPLVAWKAVLLLNSVFYGVSFVALYQLLKYLFPKANKSGYVLAIFIGAFYPGFVVMNGYVFSSTGFVLVYMLSLLSYVLSLKRNTNYLWLFGLLSGYLYWVHPLGIVPAGMAVLIILYNSMFTKRYTRKALLLALLPIAVVVSYEFIVHDFINAIMTPEGYSSWNHYDDSIGSLRQITNWDTWVRWFTLFSGHLSYILVSTFGVVGYILTKDNISRKTHILNLRQKIRTIPVGVKNYLANERNQVVIVIILNILFITLLITLLASLSGRPKRVDHWIYGRYADTVVLPLIGIGVLSFWKFNRTALMIISVLFTGLFLSVRLNSENTKFLENNLVNIISFWPLKYVETIDYASWFLIGGVGIIFIALLVKLLGKYALLAIIPFNIMAINIQSQWHTDILSGYSKPSSLYEFMSENYSDEECSGFEYADEKIITGVVDSERLRMHTYYLYSKNIVRMSFRYWHENCNGVYITTAPDYAESYDDVNYIARENISGLYIVTKESPEKVIFPEPMQEDFYINTKNQGCVIAGCYSLQADKLYELSNVGQLDGDSLKTDGSSGVLFYGPYYIMQPGEYVLNIDSEVTSYDENTILRIKGNEGNTVYYEAILTERNDNYYFSLPMRVQDFEISLTVGGETELSVNKYSIEIK